MENVARMERVATGAMTDPIECVKWILQSPMYFDHLRYSPERRSTIGGDREYADWITSDGAWFMQVRS